MTEWLAVDDAQAPVRAAEVIAAGDIIILPTDTVYGVAADWRQPDAVAALYAAKQRPPDRAIPLLLADAAHIAQVASEVPASARTLADRFWPGALTIVMPKAAAVPAIVSSLPTVGVRVPDHAATRAVIEACGGVLAVTSANQSDTLSTLTAQDAAAALGDAVALVLDGGKTPGGVPSTVVAVHADRLEVLREGPLSGDDLTDALKT